MNFLRLFPLLALLSLAPLQAWCDIPGLEFGVPLFPPTNSHRPPSPALERATVQTFLQLAPKIGKDAKSQREVAIALARLGASDAALKITQNKSVQNEVRQMAARRSLFSGTLANARHWISQLPVRSRADLQLQLARRLLLEKQPEEALEILRSIPPRTIESIEEHGDVAMAFAEAGSKTEAQKRFELLERALKKQRLATHEEGTKQVIESGMAFLAISRLRAGLPLPADTLITQGNESIIYVVSFYLDAQQESPIREILELLPPTNALDILSGELLIGFNPANDLRYKLVREWLLKIPASKRGVYVEAEVRELMWRDPIAAMKLIEEFLPPNARRQAEYGVRFVALFGSKSATQFPLELRKRWATQSLRELQVRKRQLQAQDPSDDSTLFSLLSQIFEVALVLGKNQIAQNALYERERISAELLGGEQERASLFAVDWDRAGNRKRATLWRQKIKKKKPKAFVGVLAQVRELRSGARDEEVKALLPRISTHEWQRVSEEELSYMVALNEPKPLGAVQEQPPAWFANLATPTQKAAALSQWASSLAPWEGMRWARIGEKMNSQS